MMSVILILFYTSFVQVQNAGFPTKYHHLTNLAVSKVCLVTKIMYYLCLDFVTIIMFHLCTDNSSNCCRCHFYFAAVFLSCKIGSLLRQNFGYLLPLALNIWASACTDTLVIRQLPIHLSIEIPVLYGTFNNNMLFLLY